MKVIGIAGGSASGKTSLSDRLYEATKDKANIIRLDDYYKYQANKTYEERTKTNYDHPDAFDFDLLVEHVKMLKQGQSIEKPTYDYSDHNRSSITEIIEPKEILYLEGIFTLEQEPIRNECDYLVFVKTDDDLRFIRRLKRDMVERARSAQSVISQYLETVKPMHDLYCAPSEKYADVVIYNNDHITDEEVNTLLAKIDTL